VSLENATGKAFWAKVILMASLILKSSFAMVFFTEKTGVLRKSLVERGRKLNNSTPVNPPFFYKVKTDVANV
jgi:hypothetical protein